MEGECGGQVGAAAKGRLSEPLSPSQKTRVCLCLGVCVWVDGHVRVGPGRPH